MTIKDAKNTGSTSRAGAGSRDLDIEMTVEAAVEDVWKALTDAEELTRWFPTEARVTPGRGGTIHMGWKDFVAGDQKILEWDPPRHLRTTWFEPPADGHLQTIPVMKEDPEAARKVAVDYFIEAQGGTTRLRLVHSGFSTNPIWDEEYDATRRGWRHELASLRHYLERHRGHDRILAWARRPVEGGAVEKFHRVMSPRGLAKAGSIEGCRPGEHYDITTRSGDRFEGRVLVNDPPDFAGTVSNRGDSLLRVMVEGCGGRQECHLWLCAWAISEGEVKAVEGRFRSLLADLFPEEGA